jgi:hypothetical protein
VLSTDEQKSEFHRLFPDAALKSSIGKHFCKKSQIMNLQGFWQSTLQQFGTNTVNRDCTERWGE